MNKQQLERHLDQPTQRAHVPGVGIYRATIVVAWWLAPYLSALVFFCRLHRMPPDEDKVKAMVIRGLSVRIDLDKEST